MGDPENAGSKKRVAERQISKDNPEVVDDDPELESGTFKRASDEVLATRRIVKVRRSQPAEATLNPFAAIHMVPPSQPDANSTNTPTQTDTLGDKTNMDNGAEEKEGQSVEGSETENGLPVDKVNEIEDGKKKLEEQPEETTKDDDNAEANAVEETALTVSVEKDEDNRNVTDVEAIKETGKEDKEGTEKESGARETESEDVPDKKSEEEKPENDNRDTDAASPVGSLSSFQQLSSSQNAFTGFTGTGFGTSSFSFGSIPKEGPGLPSLQSIFGFKSENTSFPSFGIGASSSLRPPDISAQNVTKRGMPLMQEVPIGTGEENEKAVFTADSTLYEHTDGVWKERGKGEVKLNVSLSDAEKARLIMRARGNYRLILNASLYPDMTLTNMEKKGVTFACINSAGEGNNAFSTFALKFKDSSFVEELRRVVATHKGKKTSALKTPENSPKASDD